MRNSLAMSGERQQVGKHVPRRTCVICRDKTNKRMLTRVVRTEQGIQVDPSGKLNGRGAYLCDRASCWERAMTTDILSRALRTSFSAEDRQRLQQAIPQP